ncbi:unnamed protein product [Closterium sp. NIES-54]
MVQQVLQRFDFTYSLPQATPLPTRHSLSALLSDESVESSGPYPELVGYLMYLMTCTRPDLAYPLSILARYVAPGRHRPEHMAAAKRVLRYLCSASGMGLVLGGRSPVVLTGHADASWADDQATQRSSQGYTFSLGSGSVLWRATRSSSVLGSSCEAEIYAGAMAAQELRWLTYLLTDLGEPPRSPPVLYVDNKAMLALCREQRLEHITKHIALRYFLARELQQRGQLRLAYVASEANTADVFTKALAPCDHQRFCTQLGCSGVVHIGAQHEFFFPALPKARLAPAFAGPSRPCLSRPSLACAGPSRLVAARRLPVATHRGPALAAHCGPALPFAARRWPVPARPGPSPARLGPLPPVAGPSPPIAGPSQLVAALPSPPVAALPYSRPVATLPCCRPSRGPAFAAHCGPALLPPQSRPCPAAAPVAASALEPPCRGPALLPPQSRPCPGAAPVAALPCCCPGRDPDLNRQLRNCPAPAPAELRRPTEPRRPAETRCPTTCTASAATAATAATTATAILASPTVLTFDAEGRAVDFDVWVDDLQLFLQCDSRDGVSLFDHTSGVSIAPAVTADSTVRSQWTTRDAVARLVVRSHLPSAERAHFGQYKTAQPLYDTVVARYSSPATAALSRLMLPYLFPDLAAFATVADLITHLCTSDARYRAALPTEFCAKNPPPPCTSPFTT